MLSTKKIISWISLQTYYIYWICKLSSRVWKKPRIVRTSFIYIFLLVEGGWDILNMCKYNKHHIRIKVAYFLCEYLLLRACSLLSSVEAYLAYIKIILTNIMRMGVFFLFKINFLYRNISKLLIQQNAFCWRKFQNHVLK